MSGISGIFNLDGSPVGEQELRATVAMQRLRGPDGTGCWQDGSIGLGHTMLATTPESLVEPQPFRHETTGCTITADLRLDNRDELYAALQPDLPLASIGDAELLVLSYLKWGEACLDRMLGDFAFALWDPRDSKLFCARDHFGMRPLYYHHQPAQRLVFASSPQAILVLPKIPYQINPGRIADFLVPELEWIDYTSSCFEGVFRLPPAHKLIATPGRVEVSEYYAPAPGPALGSMSEQDYEEGFMEVFTQSVEARLRAPPGTVGSMLSGGMDSGSVVAVGKDILHARGQGPLPTFSAVRPPQVHCAESHAIYAAVQMPFIDPVLVLLDEAQEHLPFLTSNYEEPFDGRFVIIDAVYSSASRHGQSVVLDGAGGDVVLGHGSYIKRLIQQGHLRLAMAEIIGESRFNLEPSFVKGFVRHTRATIVPETIKKMFRGLQQSQRMSATLKDSLVAKQFADNVQITERFRTLRQTYNSDVTWSFPAELANAIRPMMTAGRERYARIAAANGVEARDPYLDKRVVDYCTQLPGHILTANGWPKMILRRVMADRLPDEVRWARGKPHLGYLFSASFFQRAYEQGELSLEGLQGDLHGYADEKALADAWRVFCHDGDARKIYEPYILAKWLSGSVDRPIVPVVPVE